MSKLYLPKIRFIDIVEIIIIWVVLYMFMNWIKSTRAYNLLKGIGLILLFFLVAALFQMTTILYIARNVTGVALTAVVIIFQPELRKALEHLGQQRMISSFLMHDQRENAVYYSDATIVEVARAVSEMSAERVGALIVMEQAVHLDEYIQTGITIDAHVTSQLLQNIFEHGTPLHDGAVVIRGDRVQAATCYLPLSDSESISKKFGTRHRAGVGISEESDSFTIIVSEETGRISYAHLGKLVTGVSVSELRDRLFQIAKKYREREKKSGLFRRAERNEE